MAKGLAYPLSVNKGGGAKTVSDEAQVDKLVRQVLQEGDDENPFQDLGLSFNVIYRINDENSKFDVEAEMKEKMRTLKGRVETVDVNITDVDDNEEKDKGNMNVGYDYNNLEINEPESIKLSDDNIG